MEARIQLAKTGLACDFVSLDQWVPNFMFTHCMVPACSAAFVAFGAFGRRRHHCRRCGRLVCGSCAAHAAYDFEQLGHETDPDLMGHTARVCGECLEDMLDRLERRELTSSELQQVMVLDARLEQWTKRQAVHHREVVRKELSREFERRLGSEGRQMQANNEALPETEQATHLGRRLQELSRVDTTRLSEEDAIQHVQEVSRLEAELRQLAGSAREAVHAGNEPRSQQVARLDVVAMREQWEQLVRQDIQGLSPAAAIQHVQRVSTLQDSIEAFETQMALGMSCSQATQATRQATRQATLPGCVDESHELVNDAHAFRRSDWPLPLSLDVPMQWPTERMRRREQSLLLERRREALLVREEFEVRKEQMHRAREMQMQREQERESLRQQEEERRRLQELQAEERRRRAAELDELARRAVTQMVGRGSARMCRRCRAGPIMNENCNNLATHNRDTVNRRNANHCPRCGWFDRNWHNWPEWDGIYGPH